MSKIVYRWSLPGCVVNDGLLSAREAKPIGATIIVQSQSNGITFTIRHRDNWGDARFPWKANRSHDPTRDKEEEFHSLKQAIAHAKAEIWKSEIPIETPEMIINWTPAEWKIVQRNAARRSQTIGEYVRKRSTGNTMRDRMISMPWMVGQLKDLLEMVPRTGAARERLEMLIETLDDKKEG